MIIIAMMIITITIVMPAAQSFRQRTCHSACVLHQNYYILDIHNIYTYISIIIAIIVFTLVRIFVFLCAWVAYNEWECYNIIIIIDIYFYYYLIRIFRFIRKDTMHRNGIQCIRIFFNMMRRNLMNEIDYIDPNR